MKTEKDLIIEYINGVANWLQGQLDNDADFESGALKCMNTHGVNALRDIAADIAEGIHLCPPTTEAEAMRGMVRH